MKAAYRKIKLRASDITSGVCGLHDHLLAFDSTTREGELVASAAVRAGAVDSCEAVCEVVADGPRGLVRAHVGGAAGAAGCGIGVAEGLIVDVAALDGGGDARLAAPGAAGLAAVPGMCKRKESVFGASARNVPVASGGTAAGLSGSECGREGQNGSKGLDLEVGRHFRGFMYTRYWGSNM